MKQNRTEQNRTEQNRTEQNRTEQNRTEQILSKIQFIQLLEDRYIATCKILCAAVWRSFCF
ncbi:hypothetical protein [uncultured Treponema sp.]|uniref:hypothetical protein n=1 Tax=uncultured Treponema sp. TaxID=162155 RepID=UPI0025F5A129|nr:hypothetical protein [uncultured Treponema sp.]